jgi:hypothetical protein
VKNKYIPQFQPSQELKAKSKKFTVTAEDIFLATPPASINVPCGATITKMFDAIKKEFVYTIKYEVKGTFKELSGIVHKPVLVSDIPETYAGYVYGQSPYTATTVGTTDSTGNYYHNLYSPKIAAFTWDPQVAASSTYWKSPVDNMFPEEGLKHFREFVQESLPMGMQIHVDQNTPLGTLQVSVCCEAVALRTFKVQYNAFENNEKEKEFVLIELARRIDKEVPFILKERNLNACNNASLPW